MSPRDAIPVVKLKRSEVTDSGTVLWIVDCPHCGREHTHGAAVGHRVADCFPRGDVGGYVIERWADDDIREGTEGSEDYRLDAHTRESVKQ